MGMGFPTGMGILQEYHGNGNTTQIWEWKGVGMNAEENRNDPYSNGDRFPRISYSPLASGPRFAHRCAIPPQPMQHFEK